MNMDLNADMKIAAWNVRGMCNNDMKKEVRKFIKEENLSVCATLETHLKPKQLNKACEFVYGRWPYISNIQESTRGCRIIVGWNSDEVHVMLVHSSSQSMLCLIEITNSKTQFFCSFVYAANTGKERRELWKT
ncbi:RNA-directed DNA polymerase, eukaryota, Reverse transcriptase zinc-binding domain protein [Artemisia annua]|uniref:RNA-directed DNA polymerase, eukaryota, Reverse transcriptase zinc-binding domain protein n=1 Tax=Artemisia annua TaxID=35608 RepID=A0A2U1LFX7_ARTAN|nr:RNA-directed DNA polymerase, eukaryota, Reverse transcriptase zinc-binding domain protein [Artemisia annua]